MTFGELRLLVKEGWRPQIRLRDVSVRTLGGEEIVRFSESKAKFSMSALLGGRIAPSEITMTGVFATLLRESDGSFALQSEFSSAGGLRFETPGDAVDQIDALLSQPGLSGLDRAELRGLTLQFIDRRVQRAFTLDGGRLIATRNGDTLSVDADLALLGDAQSAVGATVRVLAVPSAADGAATGPRIAQGTVTALGPQIDAQTRTVALIVRIDDPFATTREGFPDARPIRIGELLTLELSVDLSERGAVSVPGRAVKSGDVVWRVADGVLSRSEVDVLRRGTGEGLSLIHI